jgi:spermidine/putrescine-binding protein
VTLSGGGFTGAATALASGAASFNIPANTLSSGSVTLTAAYAGDTNFNAANGTGTVTVNKPKTTPGTYTVTVTGTGNDAGHTTKTTTFALTVN